LACHVTSGKQDSELVHLILPQNKAKICPFIVTMPAV
jgi:hypothetical protein